MEYRATGGGKLTFQSRCKVLWRRPEVAVREREKGGQDARNDTKQASRLETWCGGWRRKASEVTW